MNNKLLVKLEPIEKKCLWTNRYSDRLVKLSDMIFSKMQSLAWDSKEYQDLRELRNRVSNKIYVLARYSGLITSKALSILKSK